MEDFKISNFEKEYGAEFPDYKTVSGTECKNIVEKISARYNLNKTDILSELASKQTFYPKINASQGFVLSKTLIGFGIELPKLVFINWTDFSSFDALSLTDLDKYFYDFWYPASDDIELFDESFNWILSIRHDGAFSSIKS
jgi:hypothetical protein